MKRIIMFFAPVLMLSFSCGDDDGSDVIVDLPELAQNYISSNYPDYTIDEAEQEVLCDQTQAYEVELELEGSEEELELVFDNEGSLLYSESEIKSSELPAAISTSVSTNYPDYTLDDDADVLEAPDGSLQYEVEVENSTSELELLIDADGTVICEQEDTE